MAKYRTPLKVKVPLEKLEKVKYLETNANVTKFSRKVNGGGAKVYKD